MTMRELGSMKPLLAGTTLAVAWALAGCQATTTEKTHTSGFEATGQVYAVHRVRGWSDLDVCKLAVRDIYTDQPYWEPYAHFQSGVHVARERNLNPETCRDLWLALHDPAELETEEIEERLAVVERLVKQQLISVTEAERIRKRILDDL
ncbi:MAG: hypothetical protein RIC16_12345 [Rhodospirillales bacterium]